MRSFTLKTALATLVLAAAAFCNAQDIQVQVDGTSLTFANAQPQYINGRVLVPMRRIFEKLGAQVDWNRDTQRVHAMKGSSDIELTIGKRTAMVNGSRVQLDVPAMVVDGSTMVPIRFVSEAMGAQVGWMEAEHLVTINTTDAVVTQEPQRLRGVLVPATAVINVTLDHSLDSVRNHRGDTFTGTLSMANLPDGVNLPAGSKVEGHIAAIRSGYNGRRSTLDLVVDEVRLPSGRTIHFDASVIMIDSRTLLRNQDGTYWATSDFHIPAGTEISIRARHSVSRG